MFEITTPRRRQCHGDSDLYEFDEIGSGASVPRFPDGDRSADDLKRRTAVGSQRERNARLNKHPLGDGWQVMDDAND
jgi:hypothetical protein